MALSNPLRNGHAKHAVNSMIRRLVAAELM
jgi:hypothetical protein